MGRFVLLMLHLLAGVARAAVLLPLAGPQRRIEMIRDWAARILKILAVDLVVTGHAPGLSERGGLFVANHVSWLDIYLLNAARPVRFVSKSEVRDWPVIGWLAEKTGTLFIRRSRRHDTARINSEVTAALKQGDCVALFPEGTTSDGSVLRPFHTSLLQPAIDAGARLWPVAIRYRNRDGSASTAAPYIDDMSFGASLRRILAQPEVVAEMEYLEPLAVQGRSRRELAVLAEAAIASALSLAAPGRAPGKPGGLPAAPR